MTARAIFLTRARARILAALRGMSARAWASDGRILSHGGGAMRRRGHPAGRRIDRADPSRPGPWSLA